MFLATDSIPHAIGSGDQSWLVTLPPALVGCTTAYHHLFFTSFLRAAACLSVMWFSRSTRGSSTSRMRIHLFLAFEPFFCRGATYDGDCDDDDDDSYHQDCNSER